MGKRRGQWASFVRCHGRQIRVTLFPVATNACHATKALTRSLSDFYAPLCLHVRGDGVTRSRRPWYGPLSPNQPRPAPSISQVARLRAGAHHRSARGRNGQPRPLRLCSHSEPLPARCQTTAFVASPGGATRMKFSVGTGICSSWQSVFRACIVDYTEPTCSMAHMVG